MSAVIDLSVESPGWDADAQTTVHRAIAAVLADAGVSDAAVGAVLGDDARIRELNRQWRGIDAPTNVLSFPLPADPAGGERSLGDIVLALETAERESAEEGKPLLDHLAHLAVHGTLHLLGYDHEADNDAEEMEARERVILTRLGIADPYGPADRHTKEAV